MKSPRLRPIAKRSDKTKQDSQRVKSSVRKFIVIMHYSTDVFPLCSVWLIICIFIIFALLKMLKKVWGLWCHQTSSWTVVSSMLPCSVTSNIVNFLLKTKQVCHNEALSTATIKVLCYRTVEEDFKLRCALLVINPVWCANSNSCYEFRNCELAKCMYTLDVFGSGGTLSYIQIEVVSEVISLSKCSTEEGCFYWAGDSIEEGN